MRDLRLASMRPLGHHVHGLEPDSMDTPMRALETKVPPPVVAGILGAASWWLAPATPVLFTASVWRNVVPIVLAVIGIGLAGAGNLAFRSAGTTVNPLQPAKASALVAGGIYRHTRNPMYLGILLVLLALALHRASPWALAGPLLFFAWMNRFQIVPEERALAAKFGASFEAYRKRVRRWL